MPHRQGVPDPGPGICRRCGVASAHLTVRTEPLCADCFIKYVHTKVVKRMEAFRVRNTFPEAQRKLLLPLSFGVSSLCLLHILDWHLQIQTRKTGRTGYILHILYVDEGIMNGTVVDTACIDALKVRYRSHSFSVVKIEDAKAELAQLWGGMNDSSSARDEPVDIRTLFSSLKSETSRVDMLNTLRSNLAARMAKEHDCEGILWGDSTTRLSEKILAETAKGRGFSLPWLLNDGKSPSGLSSSYPMKDLLKKELLSYVEIAEPPLTPLVRQDQTVAPVSLKHGTIDGLMTEYFESVEQNYPSIVANVLRTSSKLQVPAIDENTMNCHICNMPVPSDQDEKGQTQPAKPTNSQSHGNPFLCYGCARAVSNPTSTHG